ncbi:hypothetical protein GRS48_12620 [Halorubrum sp. JWXQ-INN 858]|uniref:hypothetical protein n=1 Tax=Halorubrum sp. JWXQ-INN 858 TaxID=2690782 RepID=UPI0013581138|nr:hypothetical protein [Halorubrum sp. JWXQ-INN 858]MWV65656.1 hypothetical protein [Halorubrum sp. JWXQ-INN 858]
MADLDEMTLRGKHPDKAAVRMLQTYDDDEIGGVKIELEIADHHPIRSTIEMLNNIEGIDIGGLTIQFEPAELRQASYDEFSGTGQRSSTETGSDDSNSWTVEPDEPDDEEDEREEGSIQPGTAHNWVLHILHELNGDERYVPGKRVRDEAAELDVSESSIYPALTNLWERKITDRTDEGGSYSYKITDHGLDVLEDVGVPEEEGE